MRLQHLSIILLILPTLACGSLLARTEVEPKPEPTRVKLVRFNTPTPLPTHTPTAAPPTNTPTLTPSVLPALPSSATPSNTEEPTLDAQANDSLPTATATRPPPPTATPLPATITAVAAATRAAQATLTVEQYHLGYGVQLAEAKNMALAVQGGFIWAKHDLNIREGANYLANADNLLGDLRKSGAQHVLLKLIVWTAGGLPDAPRTPAEVTTFANNAAEVARFIRSRYGSLYKTIAYEIWNEPNLNYEWEGNPNPAEYIVLLRATSDAIRKADPQAIIVSGAPSPGGDYDDLEFLEGMYANGAKGLMDAVGSHPYGGPWPYDRPNGFDEAGNGWSYFRKAEAQRAIMEKYGDTGTQIWATEFSWLAGLPNCDYGEHTPWQVTVQQQADNLVGAFAYAHQNWPWMGPMFVVYDFAVSGRYDRCHPASGYSILRPNPNSPDIITPAAQALFAMPKYSAW